ncbi:HPP family protein [Comamonas sp. NoAH]|uniref:HPP family protein n=1 Tax=Comamonas halotolerans TaxID=3041496 RepID=UPI0024E054F7|nr:HPP family protein [Comamonas sp. NoAH]
MVDPLKDTQASTLETGRAQLSRWGLWLRNFLPASVRIGYAEALRISVGVLIGVLVTGLLSRWWSEGAVNIWMVSSLGASAVLLFGMPASPMAQPWPVLVGTVLSALVGAAVQAVIADTAVACAVAVGLSVMLMVPLRCMHPPGAGFAAYVVLEHINGVTLVAFPILFNVAVLLVCAMIYNAITGKRYPHPQHSFKRGLGGDGDGNGVFAAEDLDAALKHYNQVLDVSRADLEGLLHIAGRSAFNRNFGNLRCKDIMSQPVFAVEPGVSQKEAWALMRQERVKALPVVDADGVVQGMVSISDFVREATMDAPDGVVQRLRHLVTGRNTHKAKVQALMEAEPQTVQADCLLVDLVPLFSAGGCHHLPVVDGQQKLLGIVTQTDLIRALSVAISVPTQR